MPDLTPEQKMNLFTRVLEWAHDGGGHPGFADRLVESPAEAKRAAQEVAATLGLTLPERDIVVFIPHRKAEHCHVFSLEPRYTRLSGEYDANDFLLCCYPLYDRPAILPLG